MLASRSVQAMCIVRMRGHEESAQNQEGDHKVTPQCTRPSAHEPSHHFVIQTMELIPHLTDKVLLGHILPSSD